MGFVKCISIWVRLAFYVGENPGPFIVGFESERGAVEQLLFVHPEVEQCFEGMVNQSMNG